MKPGSTLRAALKGPKRRIEEEEKQKVTENLAAAKEISFLGVFFC